MENNNENGQNSLKKERNLLKQCCRTYFAHSNGGTSTRFQSK